VDVEASLEPIREIPSAPPSRTRRGTAQASVSVEGLEVASLMDAPVGARVWGRAQRRITRKRMPTKVDVTVASTTGMEEDGPPNGPEWTGSCPTSVNGVSTYTVNVHVDEDILEGFNTPVQNRPTIQPDRNPPRLTRARQRLLQLNTALPEEVPGEHEDITAVDCLRMNLHDTMDSVWPPPMHMEVGGPSRAPELERWYTMSPRE
jgi:hypothetical protein